MSLRSAVLAVAMKRSFAAALALPELINGKSTPRTTQVSRNSLTVRVGIVLPLAINPGGGISLERSRSGADALSARRPAMRNASNRVAQGHAMSWRSSSTDSACASARRRSNLDGGKRRHRGNRGPVRRAHQD